MNKFEVVLIFNPDLANNSLTSEINNFKSKLTSNSAKIINELNSNFKKHLKKYNIGTHKSTINVGIVSGGENVNVVPSKTRIVVDRRITHKEDVKKAFNEIKKFILKVDKSAKVKFYV